MSRRRPWRALATASDPTSPTGRRTVGRVAACSEGALQPWVRAQRDGGAAVTITEVLALDVGAITADSPPQPTVT